MKLHSSSSAFFGKEIIYGAQHVLLPDSCEHLSNGNVANYFIGLKSESNGFMIFDMGCEGLFLTTIDIKNGHNKEVNK